MPDRLIKALASAATYEVYKDMRRFETVLTHVRAWIEEQHGKEGE
jgi:hypothetical protein